MSEGGGEGGREGVRGKRESSGVCVCVRALLTVFMTY